MRNWITRWIASALALFIITQVDPGITMDGQGTQKLVTLFTVVVALGLANSLIRPLIMVFAWPINCMTFGLLGFAVNVGLFWLVGMIVPGFHVKGPMPALIGSIAMGLISALINFILKDRGDRDNR